MKLYKFLNADMSAIYGNGSWAFEPMPVIKGDLIPCKNGYHLCRKEDLIHWLGARLFEVEHTGEIVLSDNKVVVREAVIISEIESWNKKNQRLFACDCAERVLHLFESMFPDDSRARNAIEVARLYADGKATLADLNAAGVAGVAARAAEIEWQSNRLCEYLGL